MYLGGGGEKEETLGLKTRYQRKVWNKSEIPFVFCYHFQFLLVGLFCFYICLDTDSHSHKHKLVSFTHILHFNVT